MMTFSIRQASCVLMALLAVCTSMMTTITALQLSMVSSSTPRGPRPGAFSTPRSKASVMRDPFSVAAATLAGGFDISSNFISSLAVVALKTRLADQTHVSCDVTAKSTDILVGGRVGPVTVRGRGWKSQLGLSCRAIEASVNTCELDLGKILSERKLRLIKPAEGKAMIALNAEDFGNFITHPLVKPPPVPQGLAAGVKQGDDKIRFRKEGTKIDPSTGTVTFFADFAGEPWECTLKRGTKSQRRAIIGVRPLQYQEGREDASMQLTEALTTFFNQMVFSLDNSVNMNFRDMMVTNQGTSPSLMLSLNLVVHKFPSRNAAF